jgi:hypothetical protein
MYKNLANNLFPINSHIIGGSEEDEDDENEMIDKKPIVKEEEKKELESESESESEPEKPEGELVRIIKDCSYIKEYILIFLLLIFIMVLLLLYFTDIKEFIMGDKINYVPYKDNKYNQEKYVWFSKKPENTGSTN